MHTRTCPSKLLYEIRSACTHGHVSACEFCRVTSNHVRVRIILLLLLSSSLLLLLYSGLEKKTNTGTGVWVLSGLRNYSTNDRNYTRLESRGITRISLLRVDLVCTTSARSIKRYVYRSCDECAEPACRLL